MYLHPRSCFSFVPLLLFHISCVTHVFTSQPQAAGAPTNSHYDVYGQQGIAAVPSPIMRPAAAGGYNVVNSQDIPRSGRGVFAQTANRDHLRHDEWGMSVEAGEQGWRERGSGITWACVALKSMLSKVSCMSLLLGRCTG